ncbi:putative assembly, mitochondrial proton-transport ATP synth complex [Lyophyllum shimeji]|uniref:Assembly, mitochondrial proton-transport ATP synth complex n=1 Tax=Lyophyllum shimeji TaxID=47721 RepID=A0A9P3UK59_LYOSH|nr:putative assembly, mitochondrial proton-transport ATP synth complex [Lyophyllum shimeji]
MFVVESNLPTSARVALASMALGTSGISTALVGWCGHPYVITLRHLTPEESGGADGIEMTTQTLLLRVRVTRVYDTTFLVETKRPFAKWELADTVMLSSDKNIEPGTEETIAETMDKAGNVLGRWIVKWDVGGVGKCHEVGKVVRYFNVHEELL